jgi:hypothetical protein
MSLHRPKWTAEDLREPVTGRPDYRPEAIGRGPREHKRHPDRPGQAKNVNVRKTHFRRSCGIVATLPTFNDAARRKT